MTDGLTVAAVLLVAGTVVGGIAASNPALFPVWSAPREEYLALIRAHRHAWTFINAGFTVPPIAFPVCFQRRGDTRRGERR